jgi:alpha-glucosidase (family GH31 glycosyl hydrolase)
VLSFSVLVTAGALEFDVYVGSPRRVLADYTADVGRPQVLPEWAYGIWRGQDKFASQAELLADVARVRQEGMPLAVPSVATGQFPARRTGA